MALFQLCQLFLRIRGTLADVCLAGKIACGHEWNVESAKVAICDASSNTFCFTQIHPKPNPFHLVCYRHTLDQLNFVPASSYILPLRVCVFFSTSLLPRCEYYRFCSSVSFTNRKKSFRLYRILFVCLCSFTLSLPTGETFFFRKRNTKYNSFHGDERVWCLRGVCLVF